MENSVYQNSLSNLLLYNKYVYSVVGVLIMIGIKTISPLDGNL